MHLFCPPVKLVDDALLVVLLVVVFARVDVLRPKAEGVVEQHGELPGGRLSETIFVETRIP
jgi:hypothetical protein